MKIVGLITEYNPFHKGHEYHIQKAKEITGADYCVIVMSGNYVQRGTLAFMDKYSRASIALNHGADVIFELPIPFSCSSAEYFATAAVTLLHKMGCVDYICFGSECENIDVLDNIASVLTDAKTNSKHQLNTYIKNNIRTGMNYASARSLALETYLHLDLSSILNAPNNTLSIEYLKAIKLLNSNIKPIAIERIQANYHHNENNDIMYSASSLRKTISDPSNNKDYIKELCTFDSEYDSFIGNTAPITENDMSRITGEKLLNTYLLEGSVNPCDKLIKYAGIDKDLAHRIFSPEIIHKYTSFSQFINSLKTKNITYTSLSRAILAITLNIRKRDIQAYIDNGISSYVRLLGFKREASPVFSEINKNGELTIIGQLSELNDKNTLSSIDMKMLEHSIYCDEVYNMIIRTKYNKNIPNEYVRKLIIK